MPFTALQLSTPSIGLVMPKFPQLLYSRGKYLLAEEDLLYELTTPLGTVTPVLISTFDPLTPANSKAIVTGGGRWTFTQFGTFRIIMNSKNLVIRHSLIDGTKHTVFTNADTAIPSTGTFHQGRFIRGGFAGANYWPSGWQAIWDAWLAEGSNWSQSISLAGPGKNWVWYSTIGEDDMLYHLMPTLAKVGDKNIEVNTADTIYGANLFIDGSFKTDPFEETPVLIDDDTNVWVHSTSSSSHSKKTTHGHSIGTNSTVNALTTFEIDPAQMLTPFVATNTYLIEFDWRAFRATSGGQVGWEGKLGGTSFKQELGPMGTGTVPQEGSFKGTVVCGASTSARLAVVTLEFGVFAGTVAVNSATDILEILNISIREKITTAHDMLREDRETDYFIMELLRRNQAGFIPMPFEGAVLNCLPLHDHVVIYGEDGVVALTPQSDRSLNLSFMGMSEDYMQTGCDSQDAVTGDLDEHFFIDTLGDLWNIKNDKAKPVMKKLGYGEFLKELDAPVMSFEQKDRRVFISGIDVFGVDHTYVYEGVGGVDRFSEMQQKVSSVTYENDRLVGMVEDKPDFTTVNIRTNNIDFQYAGTKELGTVEIGHDMLRSRTVETIFTNDENRPFSTGKIIGDEQGRYFMSAAGQQFQVCFEALGYRDSVKDGDFATATNWTVEGNWSVAAGVASHSGDGEDGDVFQTPAAQIHPIVAGEVYLVEYDLAYTSGEVFVVLGQTAGISRKVAGRHQEILRATAPVDIRFSSQTTFAGNITNVKVLLVGGRAHRMDVRFDYVDLRSAMSPHSKGLVG